MNDAILTARHARQTVNAAYLPYMSPATGKSAEESTHTIVDTPVSDSVICVLYGPRNLRHIITLIRHLHSFHAHVVRRDYTPPDLLYSYRNRGKLELR